MYVTLAL